MYEPPSSTAVELAKKMLRALFGEDNYHVEAQRTPFGYTVQMEFNNNKIEVHIPVTYEASNPMDLNSPKVITIKCGRLMGMLDHMTLAKNLPDEYIKLHGKTPLYKMIHGKEQEKPHQNGSGTKKQLNP